MIVPLLVYRCEEPTLLSLPSLLHPSSSSLPSLLSHTLPAAMALILPTFAQQDGHDSEAGSEDRRAKARASNNLLAKHLSEEVGHVTTIEREICEKDLKKRRKKKKKEKSFEVKLSTWVDEQFVHEWPKN